MNENLSDHNLVGKLTFKLIEELGPEKAASAYYDMATRDTKMMRYLYEKVGLPENHADYDYMVLGHKWSNEQFGEHYEKNEKIVIRTLAALFMNATDSDYAQATHEYYV